MRGSGVRIPLAAPFSQPWPAKPPQGSFAVEGFRRGRSSVGRAREWHSRGQRFDPARLHQNLTNTGRGCNSGVEHNLGKVGVEGSHPFARSSAQSPGAMVKMGQVNVESSTLPDNTINRTEKPEPSSLDRHRLDEGSSQRFSSQKRRRTEKTAGRVD